MINILLNNNLSVINYYIRNIPASAVFQFLQERTNADIALLSKQHSDKIEYLFYQLDHPLINFGLACYGDNTDIIRSLYECSTFEIRVATLGNKKIFQDHERPYDNLLQKFEIKEILLSGKSEEQEVILKNPHISSELLLDLFCKTNMFNSISELDWQKLISYTIGNKKLQTLPLTYPFMTNYKKWEEVISSAWQLTKNVEVNDDWACLLMGVYEKLYKIELPVIEINKTINRWQKPNTDKDNVDAYFSIRLHLADLMPINSGTEKKFTDSNDPAIKASYYKRFVPESINEVDKYLEIDREQFFLFAVQNENIINNKNLIKRIHEFSLELDYDELFYTRILENILQNDIENTHGLRATYN